MRNLGSTADHSDTVAPSSDTSATPACLRCRSFKKKCSRTFPSCALCAAGGHRCSYAPVSDPRLRNRQLQARIEWLTAYINQNPPPGGFGGGKSTIEDVETGADLPRALASGVLNPEPCTNVTQPAACQPETETPTSNDGPSAATLAPAGGDEGHVSPTLPSSEAAEELVDGFFRHVGRSYPCIDRTSVLTALQKSPDNFAVARSTDPEWTMLHLVLAIGADTLRRVGRLGHDTAQVFDIDYASILHHCLLSPSVATIQILVLLALYSLRDSNYAGTWTLANIASRQAIDLGLTMRCHAHGMDRDEESEKRHRVFWSVYILDRRMATSLGVRPMISSQATDIPNPRLTVNEYASHERAWTMSSLQISQQAIELSQLEGKILSRVHLLPLQTFVGLTRDARTRIVEGIRLEIENWYSRWCLLPMGETPDDAVTVQSSVSWMSHRYYYLLMLLYYPTHFSLCDGAGTVAKTSELIDSVVKYIRSVVILLQQSQVSLNRLLLCRLLPAGMVLMYASLHVPLYPLKDAVAALADILNAFEKGWTQAHAAASVLYHLHESLRLRSSQQSQMRQVPLCWNLSKENSSCGGYDDVAARECSQVFMDMLKLLQRFLGPTSSFCWGLAEQTRATPESRDIRLHSSSPWTLANGGPTTPWSFEGISLTDGSGFLANDDTNMLNALGEF